MRVALFVLLLAPVAAAQPGGRAARFAALSKQADEAKAKRDAAGRDAAAQKQYIADCKQIAGPALELAKESPKDDIAFQALAFVIRHGDAPTAADLLAKHHLNRKPLADLLGGLPPDPPPATRELMRTAQSKSTVPAVQAAAGLALGRALYEDADDAPSDTKVVAEAESVLAKVVAKHGSLPAGRGTVKGEAEPMLFVLRNLTVGKKAPEFASSDLDGQPTKLTALKGKVVVLDIWATWCGPCKAMIPHERELVERLKGKPFALVSVSADDSPQKVTDFLKSEKMPWTHWFEGKGGPNLKTWNVRYYPTIYVIDAKGVIRFKGVRGTDMDAAVDKLLAEVGK